MRAIITLLFIIFFTIVNSQENKLLERIVYEETITTTVSLGTKEYLLLFDDNSSFYEELETESLHSDKKMKIEETDKLTRMFVPSPERKKGLKEFFYNSYNTDFYYQSIHNGEHILLTKEEGNKIDWKIIEEFKDIGGFKCQKAIGFFRGREYTAWFTSEISVPFGTWKLHGLPGIIFEAYDKLLNLLLKTLIIFRYPIK